MKIVELSNSSLISTKQYRFHSVPDSHDEFMFLPHFVDKFHRQQALVVRLAKLLRGAVQRASEPIALKEIPIKRAVINWKCICAIQWWEVQTWETRSGLFPPWRRRSCCERLKSCGISNYGRRCGITAAVLVHISNFEKSSFCKIFHSLSDVSWPRLCPTRCLQNITVAKTWFYRDAKRRKDTTISEAVWTTVNLLKAAKNIYNWIYN